jgi:PTS system N-acetylglucosamine-specific IIC component
MGGSANLTSVDACTTRLRLAVAESARVDVAALTRLGAIGVVKPGPNTVQVVSGPIADQVAEEIRRYLRSQAQTPADRVAAGALALSSSDLLAALGGVDNVESVDCAPERVLVKVLRTEQVDLAALDRFVPRGIAITRSGLVHVLLGPGAAQACHDLRDLLT